jgi:hypothetical protein
VQTELGFGGGTVMVTINRGSYEFVPAEDYVFNAPSVLAIEDEQAPTRSAPRATGSA